MWQAAFKEGKDALPKALPHAISHVSYEGPPDNPTPGLTSRTIHLHRSYAEAMAKERQSENVVLLVKQKLLEMDAKALRMRLEMVEGGIVGSSVKSAKECINIVEGPVPGASCVVHWSFEYEPLSEQHQARVPLILNEFIPHLYKKLEEYLVSHHDYLQ
ncbi:hypothetical protein GOP47_0005134 [Adiantum capillus-veneris]|nr:hypothetical protein GOP47_0005134 [Adiantum capillus-veneris]